LHRELFDGWRFGLAWAIEKQFYVRAGKLAVIRVEREQSFLRRCLRGANGRGL
jgi:hypothetical protein